MPVGKTVVAIHQPNFFPWLGYFNKILYADAFVVLDNVQFSKTGGTWSNRVRLMVNGRAGWVTMPVVRAYHGVRLIREMRIGGTAWRSALLQSIRSAYGPAAHFATVFPFLADLINNPTDRLAEYNLAALRALTGALRLDPAKLIVGSTLGAEGKGTDLLIAMVRAVGGTAYLCGGGATEYQQDEQFVAAGIELIYQNFRHPVYRQGNRGEFTAGLSIIDALMNCGFEETRALVLSSQPSLTADRLCEPSRLLRPHP